MSGNYSSGYKVGDLVELRSGLKGIVVSLDSIGAKNTVGRAGVVDIVEVMTEKGEIGRVMSHQLSGVIRATLP